MEIKNNLGFEASFIKFSFTFKSKRLRDGILI